MPYEAAIPDPMVAGRSLIGGGDGVHSITATWRRRRGEGGEDGGVQTASVVAMV